MNRQPYPSDVTDKEWAFVVPYLTLMTEDAPQQAYDLREVFNGVRWMIRTGAQWRILLRLVAEREAQPSAVILDSRTVQSTPTSGGEAGYDGAKKRRGRTVHLAVDMLGHWLAAYVTAANAQDRVQVAELAEQVQAVSGGRVEVAFVDQGYTAEQAVRDAASQSIRLEVIKLSYTKRGCEAHIRFNNEFQPSSKTT